MRHRHEDEQSDALNDYLDGLVGSAPDQSGDLDPMLRENVDRFFELADKSGARSNLTASRRRQTMQVPIPATALWPTPQAVSQHLPAPRRWGQFLSVMTTGLLVVIAVSLIVIAYGQFGMGNGNGGNQDPTHFAAAPIGTMSPDEVTSARPYPAPDVCTVDPMTRDEMIAHLNAANIATPTTYTRYQQWIKPSADDAEAILTAYDTWKACGLSTSQTGPEYQLRLQTPWFTANMLPMFYGFGLNESQRPVSEEVIEEHVDALLSENRGVEMDATAVAATPAASPPAKTTTQTLIPIPEDATPVTFEGGRSFPTLFAEDIAMTGPDTATAVVYFVNENTGAVNPGLVYTIEFVRVDGQWLINAYTEGNGKG